MVSQLPAKDLDALWDPLDAVGSERALQALLPDAESAGSEGRGMLIELLAQLARAQTALKKMPEARLQLSRAEELLREPGSVGIVARLRWLIEKGRIYILDKTPSQARLVFVEALTLAGRSGEDHFVIELAQLMAGIEPPKAQMDWILKAIQMAEQSPQTKAKQWLGSLYASLGWKLYDLHQYEQALEIFRKSLVHLKSYGSARDVFVARWSTGKILRVMNRLEEALAIQKGLFVELGLADSPVKGALDGRLYEELAECLQALQRPDEAQHYFELAYRELSRDEWVTDNQPVKLKRMKDLGKVRNPPRD